MYYADDDEIDLLDLLIVLAKHKVLIFFMTFLFGVASIAYVLLATPIYRASTRILPPMAAKQSQAMSMMSQVPGFAAGFAADALGIKAPGDLVVGIINSRTIKDKLIDRFDLQARYETETRDTTREALANNTSATTDTKTGLVVLSTMDKDPEFAATLANAYVKDLQDFLQEIAISDAAQQRLFLEEQVKETHVKLLQAENELAEYQKKTGILNASRQASSLMSAIATFRARISAKEVELEALRTYASPNNPKVQQLQAEIQGLKEQTAKLQAQATEGSDQSFNLSELPDAGMEYLRKMRDQKFYETLYGLLLRQFEQAKMAEARDPAIIQVIDEAVPPELKAKPQRKKIVILATVLGFFLSVFFAFVMEFFAKASQDSERKEKLDKLRTLLWLKKKEINNN
jgi:uncharacterized protein involved in exopolysaccharide biosynthesis